MSLARIKTWLAGDLLTALDLNNEFNNILSNPNSLISPSTGAINFALQSHTNLPPGAITATSGSVGQALVSNGSIATWGSVVGAGGQQVNGLVGSMSSQVATLQFLEALVRTTSANASYVVVASSAFTANVGTAGPVAGGRDQAAVISSTFVHLYVITTGPGSTAPAGLVSSSPPNVGPTLPANYTAWGYLGASPYSSNSTTFTRSHAMVGAWTWLSSEAAVVADGRATTEATVSLTATIPSNCLEYKVHHSHYDRAGTAATCTVRVLSAQDFFAHGGTLDVSAWVRYELTLPNIAQTYFYIWGADPTAGGGLHASVAGWKNPIGGG